MIKLLYKKSNRNRKQINNFDQSHEKFHNNSNCDNRLNTPPKKSETINENHTQSNNSVLRNSTISQNTISTNINNSNIQGKN